MSEIELKPCPFCGGKAVLHVNSGVCVICTKCESKTMTLADGQYGGRYSGDAVKSVIEKWNRRTG